MLERIHALIEKMKSNEEHRHDLADMLLQMGTRITQLEQTVEALVSGLEAKAGVTSTEPAAPADGAPKQVETAQQA